MSFLINYEQIARENEKDAERLKRIIDKYKSELKNRKINREMLNNKIYKLDLIYAQLIGTAENMRRRGNNERTD
ncbi:MAG: hypothetical protein IIU14_07890 [Ruminococcus sp.]|nr:hypothetical protein [Ruminococcus sp.]